jgi:GDP-L-fucose synthase
MDKNSKILITGGQGWIGPALGLFLTDQGFQNVSALAGATFGIDLGLDSMVGWAFETNPDIVIHLATRLPTRGYSLEYPAALMYENMLSTCKVMEEARLCGCSKFITAWESSCYPENAKIPYKEEDLWEGSPHWTKRYYGNTAKTLMEMNMAFSTQFEDFIGVNLIFPEVYGPGSGFSPSKGKVIESVITNLKAAEKAGQPLIVNGNSDMSRDFLYLSDAIDAIHYAIMYADEPNTYNVSDQKEVNIKDLHFKVKKIFDIKAPVQWQEDKQDVLEKSVMDSSLIQKELGWRPKVDIDRGLDSMSQWYDAAGLDSDYIPSDTIGL